MDKVDATMANVNEQRELANEIAEAISNPMNSGFDLDEVVCHFLSSQFSAESSCSKDELKAELDELEQDELNEQLRGAERAPVHAPVGKAAEGKGALYDIAHSSTSHFHVFLALAQEDDEEGQLRELQAALAM